MKSVPVRIPKRSWRVSGLSRWTTEVCFESGIERSSLEGWRRLPFWDSSRYVVLEVTWPGLIANTAEKATVDEPERNEIYLVFDKRERAPPTT